MCIRDRVKVRTMHLNAFESVNVPPVGLVSARGMTLQQPLLIHPRGKFRLNETLCEQVFLLDVYKRQAV